MRISALFLLISLLFFCASWLSEAATCSQGYRSLALGSIAKQSSTENDSTTAENGIDGVNGSVVLTKQELFPFWEVVLPSTFIIYSIIINERTDCCPDLPSDFMVLLYNESCVLVMTHYFIEEPVSSGVWKVDTQGVEARSVAIRLVDNSTPRAITFGEITLCGVDAQKVPMNRRMICSDGTPTEPLANYTSCNCTCLEPISAGSLSHQSVPAGSCSLGYTECCYAYFPGALPWGRARDVCLAHGGDLASISSQDEYDFVLHFTTGSIWIGFNDLYTETFVWSDGSPTTFTSWNNGEPNNLFIEYCTETLADGKWNNLECKVPLPFICKVCQSPSTFSS